MSHFSLANIGLKKGMIVGRTKEISVSGMKRNSHF